MNNKVKIGILGCADIAGRFSIKAFQALDNAEVISIASRNRHKAEEWAVNFGIKAERSYDSLLKNKDIDAVYIPLPIGLHREWVIRAAIAGKHIICEKSLSGDYASALKMVEACKSKGVVLYENFMCDFHPQHEKVLEIIRDGDIGRPSIFRSYFGFTLPDKKNIRFDKNLEGGSLNDAGAYTVFMARKIFGKEPIAVTCNLLHGTKNGVDVRGSAMIEFQGGKTAIVAFSFESVYQNNYSLWGSEGMINVGRAYSIPYDMKPDVELIKNDRVRDSKTSIDVPAVNQFELIFRDFCATIAKRKIKSIKINNNYNQIIAQARAMGALRLSAKENRKVRVSEV